MEKELPPQIGQPEPEPEPEPEHRPEEEEFGGLEYGGWRLEDAWTWKGRKGNGGGVMLEGYVDGGEQGSDGGGLEGGGVVGRTKSLTDDDLEELKGCLDLGFGFSYEEIPELCTTLPALELCYSMDQRFLLDERQQQQQPSGAPVGPREGGVEHGPGASNPIANWKFSSPGDDPEDVKARLKYWAQAVACTVRLCS